MKNSNKFRVRVLFDSVKHSEYYDYDLTYDEAVSKFVYYVRACLECNLNIRCVNIFSGRKCIKLFCNHG